MAQARAKAFLKQKSIEDRNALLDQWETLQADNVKAQERSALGKMIGVGAAMLIPGLPLWGAMLAAGIGSRVGSEVGEHWGGSEGVVGSEGIDPVGTGSMLRRELQDYAEGSYGQFGEEQTMEAISDAISMFSLGGGSLTGGNILDQLGGPSKTGLNTSLFNIFNSPEVPAGINTSTSIASPVNPSYLDPYDSMPNLDYGDPLG